MSQDLIQALQLIQNSKILVIGDLILDRYVWGEAERISQEAPVILLDEQREEVRLGGAANVAQQLKGLKADVTIVGVVGTDTDGWEMRTDLENRGINCLGLIKDSSRPTTVKRRYLGSAHHRIPHQMFRVDREVRTPIDSSVEKQLTSLLSPLWDQYDAILVSDYAKGVCTSSFMQHVIQQANQRNVPVIVDPPGHGDFQCYQDATALTPNRSEAERATGLNLNSIDDAIEAGRIICSERNLKSVFVTVDQDGIVLVTEVGNATHLPTRQRDICDITGAGDTVLAVLGAGYAANIPQLELTQLANLAGGLQVEKTGVVTITLEDLMQDLLENKPASGSKIASLTQTAEAVRVRQKLGQRIVMTNGCFDLLHQGHLHLLKHAAAEGDCLVVAINSDESIGQLNKGSDRPVIPAEHRAAMLEAMEMVDFVVIFDESTPHRVIHHIKPDLLVKGGSYAHEEIVGWELIEAMGGEVKSLPMLPEYSTTHLLDRIRNGKSEALEPLCSSGNCGEDSQRTEQHSSLSFHQGTEDAQLLHTPSNFKAG